MPLLCAVANSTAAAWSQRSSVHNSCPCRAVGTQPSGSHFVAKALGRVPATLPEHLLCALLSGNRAAAVVCDVHSIMVSEQLQYTAASFSSICRLTIIGHRVHGRLCCKGCHVGGGNPQLVCTSCCRGPACCQIGPQTEKTPLVPSCRGL